MFWILRKIRRKERIFNHFDHVYLNYTNFPSVSRSVACYIWTESLKVSHTYQSINLNTVNPTWRPGGTWIWKRRATSFRHIGENCEELAESDWVWAPVGHHRFVFGVNDITSASHRQWRNGSRLARRSFLCVVDLQSNLVRRKKR